MSVQPVEAFSPYSTASSFMAALPTWMNKYDAARIASYQVYEQMYWSVQGTYEIIQRGSDADPIYLPTPKTLVDATNRFLCNKPGFLMDPDVGTPEEQEAQRRWWSNFFRRERWWSKFQANKRFGIIRGDWLWHVLANPAKEAGKRLSIEPLDPGAYFPVTHPNDPDRIIAVHIVEQFTDAEGTVFIKRQTYTKGADPANNDGSDTTIWNSIGLFEVDAWEALDSRATTVLKEPTALPAQITSIPVYHVPNFETPGDPFGSSELRGLERVLAAINQGISDEELVLALEGLGMYATDGGPPRNEQGQIVNWQLGPGMVVEHGQGSKFERVTGITTVAPMQEHLKMLIESVKEASATPDVTIGKVDSQTAESGIALAIQFGPMLAKVEEREDTIIDVHNQMLYDIATMWLPAYEQIDSPAVPIMIFGDPLPENRDAKFKEIVAMATSTPPLMDLETAHLELGKLGYVFPTDAVQKIQTQEAMMARATDPFASRMDEEEQQGE